MVTRGRVYLFNLSQLKLATTLSTLNSNFGGKLAFHYQFWTCKKGAHTLHYIVVGGSAEPPVFTAGSRSAAFSGTAANRRHQCSRRRQKPGHFCQSKGEIKNVGFPLNYQEVPLQSDDGEPGAQSIILTDYRHIMSLLLRRAGGGIELPTRNGTLGNITALSAQRSKNLFKTLRLSGI